MDVIVLQEVVRKSVGVDYSIATVLWLLSVIAGGLGGYFFGMRMKG